MGPIDSTAIPTTIGAWIGDGNNYSNSCISDVQFYDTVLGPAAIADLAAAASLPEPATLAMLGFGGLLTFRRRRRA
jgi:hypothetical protein